MAEYISREAMLKNLTADLEHHSDEGGSLTVLIMRRFIKYVEDFPAADVQPVDRWISVKDRMPDTPEEGLNVMYSDCCLVCDEFGWCGMAYYITDGQKSWWEFADAQNKNKIDWTEVSHWQPLPEPPKDGDSE